MFIFLLFIVNYLGGAGGVAQSRVSHWKVTARSQDHWEVNEAGAPQDGLSTVRRLQCECFSKQSEVRVRQVYANVNSEVC